MFPHPGWHYLQRSYLPRSVQSMHPEAPLRLVPAQALEPLPGAGPVPSPWTLLLEAAPHFLPDPALVPARALEALPPDSDPLQPGVSGQKLDPGSSHRCEGLKKGVLLETR